MQAAYRVGPTAIGSLLWNTTEPVEEDELADLALGLTQRAYYHCEGLNRVHVCGIH
jgi:hypothetical protein